MEDNLRFAPLIRVSTESQERRGHSLEVQTKTLTKAVSSLGGIIPEDCWEYSGQEHATKDHERQKFTKLLYDCQQNKFDAIIVYDPSRWSRDNRRSKEGLEVLKQNGIRFFVGTTEYNLFDPQASLFLGMSTEMNEYFALEQSRKSILSRIERAKNNRPSVGKLPFGRTFDKATGLWGVDEDKRHNIAWAANQYLAGESLAKLAKKLGMNHSNLWKVLNHRSGTKWVAKFEDKRLQIDEVVTLTIPALLPDKMIDAIHEKAEFNKKFDRKAIKNKYLLSRTIYCAECELAMHGQASSKGRLYYRHSRNGNKACPQRRWSVPAAMIEQATILQIYSLFGDKKKLEKAIIKAAPNTSMRPQLMKENKELRATLGAVKTKQSNLLDAVADGVFVADVIKTKMDVLLEKEKVLKAHIANNMKVLNDIPSEKDIKKKTTFAQNVLRYARSKHLRSVEHLSTLTWEEQRKLVELVFSGVYEDGERDGVYVKKDDKTWHYELHGSFSTNINGALPMTRNEIIDLLSLDADHFDAQLDLLSKC
jgi:site-specific DNA recombinase